MYFSLSLSCSSSLRAELASALRRRAMRARAAADCAYRGATEGAGTGEGFARAARETRARHESM